MASRRVQFPLSILSSENEFTEMTPALLAIAGISMVAVNNNVIRMSDKKLKAQNK
jgi:hypothetical protein